MDSISEAIFNHLNMKTTGALLLTGEWGSGKTFYMKNTIFPLIESKTKFIPVIISLYGEVDKNNIAQKVLFEYFDKKGKKVNLSTGAIAKNIKNITNAIPKIKDYIDIDKLIVGTGDNIFKLLPYKKLMICFDDIERMNRDKVDISDFLGLVNELVENKGCKVILIANEEKIKNGIDFKEKSIEKTIYFSPNISFVFDEIVNTYDSQFKDYLTSSKEIILKTLNPKMEDKEEEDELIKSFSNIRTLKFAIEHFRIIYLILVGEKEIKEKLLQKQLRNIWIFILSISVEFRKPNNISYKERKKLDSKEIHLFDITFGQLDGENERGEETPEELIFLKKFKKIYYFRLSEPYFFFPEVYDLITSGKGVSKQHFLNHLNQEFDVQGGKVNPAQELLNQFLHTGYWSFTDEEFGGKLKELLKYVGNGGFNNIISYLNTAVYLFQFVYLIDISKDQIETQVKEGINKSLINGTMVNTGGHLDMISGNFEGRDLQSIINYIKHRILEIERENDKQEVIKLESLLLKDPESFVKKLIPDNSGFETPENAIFHKFESSKVIKAIESWQPKEIVALISLLKVRYIQSGFTEKLVEELSFVETIEEGIKKMDFEQRQKPLSNYLIKNELLPIVNKCKERLLIFKNR